MSNIHDDIGLALKWLSQVMRWEGVKTYCYKDGRNILTIGIGHNLRSGKKKFKKVIGYYATVTPLSWDQIRALYYADFLECIFEARKIFTNYDAMPEIARGIIADMIFNMGIGTFKKFKRMIRALKKGDYIEASKEMANSKWGRKSHRAKKYIPMMEDLGDF